MYLPSHRCDCFASVSLRINSLIVFTGEMLMKATPTFRSSFHIHTWIFLFVNVRSFVRSIGWLYGCIESMLCVCSCENKCRLKYKRQKIIVQIRIRSIRLIEIKREMINMYLMFGTLLMLVLGFRVNAAGRGKKLSFSI